MTQAEAARQVGAHFHTWYAVFVRYAARWAGSIDAAEDVVQETLLQLYQELLSGKVIRNLPAWTFCVVRRKASKRWRSLTQDREAEVQLAELENRICVPIGSLDPESYSDRARKFFSILTPREEQVILLRMTAMKYREIAAELDMTVSSVNTLLIRALRKLKAAAVEEERGDPTQHDAKPRLPRTLQ